MVRITRLALCSRCCAQCTHCSATCTFASALPHLLQHPGSLGAQEAMAPSIMTKKAGPQKKGKMQKSALSAKPKVAMKPKASSREEVERSLKIASMLLEQEEVVHSEDEGLSDDEYIKSLRVDPIAVDKDDDGFEVDKGEEGIVKVSDVKVGKAGEVKVEVPDTREKRPKVSNSLRSLRLAIAAKMKKTQDDRKTILLAKGGFESDDEEE